MSTANSRAKTRLATAILVAFLCLSLPACATIERHPVLTAVGSAIIVGSIAASIEHHHDHQQRFRDIQRSIGPQIRTDACCGPDCPNRSSGIIGTCVGR